MEAALGTERRGIVRRFPGTAPHAEGPAGSNVVLGMLLFVATEAMFFAGLVSAYLVLRAGVGIWPPPDQPRFPVGVTALNTLVLLASAWTMTKARAAIRAGRAAALTTWLGRTAALGAVFLVVQGVEWFRLLRHGLIVTGGVYGGLFVALVGTHALHVAGGLAAVVWAWAAARGRLFSAPAHDGVTGVQIFWLFVVGVWPILYWLVYLW